MTPILSEIAANFPETEQVTSADLDRLRAELLNPDSLPAKKEETGEGLKPLHSRSVSSVPGGTHFNEGRL